MSTGSRVPVIAKYSVPQGDAFYLHIAYPGGPNSSGTVQWHISLYFKPGPPP